MNIQVTPTAASDVQAQAAGDRVARDSLQINEQPHEPNVELALKDARDEVMLKFGMPF